MAQQINLHIPVLLAPAHRFSARAIAQALAVLALLLAVACAAVLWNSQRLAAETRQTLERQTAERTALQRALETSRQQQDPVLLERQWQGAQLELQRLREQVAAQDSRRLPDGVRHSTLLALMARSVPESAWVTQARLAPQQVEISGVCLEPAALRRWIEVLGRDPALGAQAVADLRVEQVGEPHQGLQRPDGQAAAPWQTGPLPRSQAWAFRLVATRPLLGGPSHRPELTR